MMSLKKAIRLAGTYFAAAAMMLSSTIVASAAETDRTYTVTYRPGNVGYFAISPEEEGEKQDLALSVAKEQYVGYQFEVTKNGAIKVFVPAGQEAPEAPRYIVAKDGYFVRDTGLWAPAVESVDKNMDFVVDYGKLISGVEYRVEYVDSASGESIAPVYITKGNIGDKREVTAPAQIIISSGTVYNLSSKATIEKELDADLENNVFSFAYTMAPRGVNVTEEIEYVDGGVIVVTENVVTTVVTGTATSGTTAGANGGNANTDVVEPEGEDQNPEGGEVVDIPDENPPLADDATDDEEPSTEVIEEEEVPLAPEISDSNEAGIVWLATIAVLFAVILAVIWLVVRKRRKNSASEESNQE